ncbi:MAG: c-type cytochrome [Steroidobacteraceae bacterium]
MGRLHDLISSARLHGRIPAAVIGALLLAWGVHAIHRHLMIARLLLTDADQVLAQDGLSRFARAQGRPLYGTFCSSCHGVNLTGDRRLGVPDLTDDDWLYGSGEVSEIERVILYGIRAGNGKGWNLASMPAYASAVPYGRFTLDPLTPGDIRDTVEYLRTLERRPADAAAAQRGEQIFRGRGACFDCHAADGRGDTAIGAPNLTDDVWLYGDGSRQSVFESIARGHHGSCPAWTHRLSAWQARALAVYVGGAARSARKPP